MKLNSLLASNCNPINKIKIWKMELMKKKEKSGKEMLQVWKQNINK